MDDNLDDLELTQLAFEETGSELSYQFAQDPLLALKQLEEHIRQGSALPHLLVLDVNMPTINGIDFLQSLQAAGVTSRTVVVMLTTSGRPEDEQRCLALGARAYVVKPDRFEDLVQLAKRLLGYC